MTSKEPPLSDYVYAAPRKWRGFILLWAIMGVLAYVLTYVAYRNNHSQLWEADNRVYVIYPTNNPLLYKLHRPLMYLDGAITGIRFHIGPHRVPRGAAWPHDRILAIFGQETVLSLRGDTLVVMKTLISPDSGVRQEMRVANADTLFITLILEGERISWTDPGIVPVPVPVDTPLSLLLPEFMEPFLATPSLIASGEANYQILDTTILDGTSVCHYSLICDSHATAPRNQATSLEAWISDSGWLLKQVSTTPTHRIILYPITYNHPVADSAFLIPDKISR